MLDGDGDEVDDDDEVDDGDAKRNPRGLAAVTAAIEEVRRATTENDRTSMTAELGRSRRGRAAAADLIVNFCVFLCRIGDGQSSQIMYPKRRIVEYEIEGKLFAARNGVDYVGRMNLYNLIFRMVFLFYGI